MAEKQAVQEAPAVATETEEKGAFATLLQREFRPQTDQVAQRIEGAVQILTAHARLTPDISNMPLDAGRMMRYLAELMGGT